MATGNAERGARTGGVDGNTVISLAGFEPVSTDASGDDDAPEHGATTDVDGIGSETDGDGNIIDPSSLTGSGDAGTGKRKRGRPAGSGGGSRTAGKRGRPAKSASETTRTVTQILFMSHLMLANMAKVPVLAISQDEAGDLAKAVTTLTELYDMPLPDEKVMAWIALATVGARVYGTRAIVFAKAMNEKKTQQQTAPGPVIVMPDLGANKAD